MREGKQQHAVCSNVWSVFNLNNPKIYAMERNQSSALVRLSSSSLRLSFAFGVVGVFTSIGSAASTSKDTYYVNDHLASTVATSDAAGEIAQIEADAFGTQTGVVAKDSRFTGKPYDADLGAYVFPFRNYRSDEARWISADPSGFPDGVNATRYAASVLSAVDPLGLMTVNESGWWNQTITYQQTYGVVSGTSGSTTTSNTSTSGTGTVGGSVSGTPAGDSISGSCTTGTISTTTTTTSPTQTYGWSTPKENNNYYLGTKAASFTPPEISGYTFTGWATTPTDVFQSSSTTTFTNTSTDHTWANTSKYTWSGKANYSPTE